MNNGKKNMRKQELRYLISSLLSKVLEVFCHLIWQLKATKECPPGKLATD
jgi:hypothetical protein